MTSRSSPCTFSRFLMNTGSCHRVRSKKSPARDLATLLVEEIFHEALLLGVEGDDAKRLLRSRKRVLQAPDHIGNDGFASSWFTRPCRARTRPPAHGRNDGLVRRQRGGECHQLAAVIVLVRERDQALVPAAIMPVSRMRDVRSETLVEDTLLVLDSVPSSISSTPRSPTLVGGNCSGSPTMITWLPRAIAPMASQTGICDASSKMTTSKGDASGGRYWAMESGLIITQGVSFVSTLVSPRIGGARACALRASRSHGRGSPLGVRPEGRGRWDIAREARPHDARGELGDPFVGLAEAGDRVS